MRESWESSGSLRVDTDLTWAQLKAAMNGSEFVTIIEGRVVLDPGLLTGDTFDSLNDHGVIEFMHKLREACALAQTSANSGRQIGNRLSAFPPAVYSTPVQGAVTVTQQIISRVPLDPSQILGPLQ